MKKDDAKDLIEATREGIIQLIEEITIQDPPSPEEFKNTNVTISTSKICAYADINRQTYYANNIHEKMEMKNDSITYKKHKGLKFNVADFYSEQKTEEEQLQFYKNQLGWIKEE